MMSCDTNQLLNVETKQIVKSLFSPLRQKQSVKIILTTQSEGDTVTFLQDIAKETLSDGFVTRDEQLTWGDLTRSSQEKLLESVVSIQGSEIALNEMISADSPLPISLSLAELLWKRLLKIGEDSLSKSNYNYYDESCYIDRTFIHQVIVKHNISNSNEERRFPDFLATTETEFKQLCQLNAKCNVHWLEKDKSGNLVWRQSQGNLETLRRYIDTDSSHTYTADDLDKLLEQAQHQRVMLISDTAGMGKSTLLTHLSKQIKQKFPGNWVVRIDLNDHTDALKALKQEQIDKEKAIEFVSEKTVKHKPGLEVELFKKCCEKKQHVKIVIMLDGFDEISPSFKETVIDLLQALRQTAVEQLWVTTRPHLRNALEDKLQQLSYTLEPFSEVNQVEFLTKFWSLRDWFIEMVSKEKEEKEIKLTIYAKELIKKLSQSISDKDKQFTGIPLQCRMFAEAFDKEVKTFCQSTEFRPDLSFNLDLVGLYEIFLNRKHDICAEEKFKIPMTNVGAEVARKLWVKTNVENHQILALKLLFPEEQLALLHNNSQCTSSDEDLTKTGIVQMSNEGKLHFIHRTFAEFYVADLLVNELKKESNISQEILSLFLGQIYCEEYHVIRAFIDGLLSKSEPSNEVIKQCANLLHIFVELGILTLHTAVRYGDVNIIRFLLNSLEKTGHAATFVNQLVAQKRLGHTAWQMAVLKGRLEVLQTLWDWAKNVMKQQELNNMFFGKDAYERTAWHIGSEVGQIKVLHKMWEWAKEILTPEELKSIFLAKDGHGRTAWHIASEVGHIELLHKLWEWAKEVLTQDELKSMFYPKDAYERTTWQMELWEGQIEVLHKLCEWAKEVLTPEELKSMFLAKLGYGRTAGHIA